MCSTVKQVAIIGSGPCGLVTAKEMLQQSLVPVIFEKEEGLGGVWCKDKSKAWLNLKMNITKYMESFSDFNYDKSVPLYPSRDDALNYLSKYAEHNNLIPHFKFNSEVVEAYQLDDKRWNIKWKTTKTDDINEAVFDFLVVATGLYTYPFIPEAENIENFQGMVIHSKNYPFFKGSFNGKKVLVISNGVSGADISGDLALDGALVINVFNRPCWIVKRCLPLDPKNPNILIPYDTILFSRQLSLMTAHLKTFEERNAFMNTYLSSILKEQNKFKDLYIDPLTSDEMKISPSETYMDSVKKGQIIPKRTPIKSFNEKGVYLNDGSYEEIDALIWCTGYRVLFPFFNESTLKAMEYEKCKLQPLILYKGTIPANVENLAFIGFIRETFWYLGEIQARWVSLLFSSKLSLPSKDKIEHDLIEQRKIRTILPQPQYTREDLIQYIDEIANEIGALPDFVKIKETDEELYNSLIYGPALPVHYRLNENKKICLKVIKEFEESVKNLN